MRPGPRKIAAAMAISAMLAISAAMIVHAMHDDWELTFALCWCGTLNGCYYLLGAYPRSHA